MGIPQLYRWLVERYPLCHSRAVEHYGTRIDNLYLDLNSIIHEESHGNDTLEKCNNTHVEVFDLICRRISKLSDLIKPDKILYIAVDGVAPRAKINQQRSRRFLTAKDLQPYLKDSDTDPSLKILPSNIFDPNCITPGTDFMCKLDAHIKNYIRKILLTDPKWQGIKIMYSGYRTPGEGEHKIMEYIKYQRSQPSYNNNTRHCLYSPDADLIILSLLTHEPHFCILRKAPPFMSKGRFRWKKRYEGDGSEQKADELCIFYTSVFRDYLNLEFSDIKVHMKCEYDLERIINDFSVLTFFVGNDFLPNLPFTAIMENHLLVIIRIYKECLVKLGEYLSSERGLNLKILEEFFRHLNQIELDKYTQETGISKWFNDKTSKEITEVSKDNQAKIEFLDSTQKAFLDNLLLCVSDTSAERCTVTLFNASKRAHKFMMCIVDKFNSIITQHSGYTESSNLHHNNVVTFTTEGDSLILKWPEIKIDDKTRAECVSFVMSYLELKVVSDANMPNFVLERAEEKSKKEYQLWKSRYYMEKASFDPLESPEELKHMLKEYLTGLRWVNQYYVSGIRSWRWFYPFHYAPLISDLKNFDLYEEVEFIPDTPYDPITHLTAVVPKISSPLLPAAFVSLIASPDGPLAQYCRDDYVVDPNGKKAPWEAVLRIPFIDDEILLSAVSSRMSFLTLKEKERNRSETQKVYYLSNSKKDAVNEYSSPALYNEPHVIEEVMDIPRIHNPSQKLLPKTITYYWDLFGFPTLSNINYSYKLCAAGDSGYISRQVVPLKTVVIRPKSLLSKLPLNELAEYLLGKTKLVAAGWPKPYSAKCNFIYSRSSNSVSYINLLGNITTDVVSKALSDKLSLKCDNIVRYYEQNYKIEIGPIDYCVSVSEVPEIRQLLSKIFVRPLLNWRLYRDGIYPIQLILDSYDFYMLETNIIPIYEEFPIGKIVYFTKPGLYGYFARVLKSDPITKRLTIVLNHDINSPRKIEESCELIRKLQLELMDYKTMHTTAKITKISPDILGIITSRFKMQVPSYSSPINICLSMKSSSKLLKKFGFTSYNHNGVIEFSKKARDLIQKFKNEFPELITTSFTRNNFRISDAFPPPDTLNRVDQLLYWLKKNGIDETQLVNKDYDTLEPQFMKMLDNVIRTYSNRVKDENSIVLIKDVPLSAVVSCSHPMKGQSFDICNRVALIDKEVTSNTFPLYGTVIEVINCMKIKVKLDYYPEKSKLKLGTRLSPEGCIICNSEDVISASYCKMPKFFQFNEIERVSG